MKKKTVELEVDFIGSQDELTKEEKLALSSYFAKRKEEKIKSLKRVPKSKKKKAIAKIPLN